MVTVTVVDVTSFVVVSIGVVVVSIVVAGTLVIEVNTVGLEVTTVVSGVGVVWGTEVVVSRITVVEAVAGSVVNAFVVDRV